MKPVRIHLFIVLFTDNKLHLKSSHSYYHQVQLQLYVCGNKAAFCDFCMYTMKDVLVERIYYQTSNGRKMKQFNLTVIL